MIHPLADVQTTNIGKNTVVWQYAVILKNAVIGENCNINCHTFIENDVVLGNNVTLKAGVYLWDGTRLGDHVFVGPNVTFINDRYPRSKQNYRQLKTVIERGASIGAASTLMCGITVGKFAMVGAASLVTKNVPPFTLWHGHVAKHKGYVTRKGVIIDLNLFDKKTGDKYELKNGEPIKTND